MQHNLRYKRWDFQMTVSQNPAILTTLSCWTTQVCLWTQKYYNIKIKDLEFSPLFNPSFRLGVSFPHEELCRVLICNVTKETWINIRWPGQMRAWRPSPQAPLAPNRGNTHRTPEGRVLAPSACNTEQWTRGCKIWRKINPAASCTNWT